MKNLAVIMAAYKAERWIDTAVRSVLAQKLPDGWEVDLRIGVDGCPATAKALDKISVPYWRAAKNAGLFPMRNSLIKLGPADAFTCFDADDEMLPGYLAALLKAHAENAVVSPMRIQCHPDLTPTGKPPMKANGMYMISGELMSRLGGFRDYRCAADSDMRQRAEALSGERRIYVREAIFRRRAHPGSLTHAPATRNGGEYRHRALNEMTALRRLGEMTVENPATVPLERVEP